MSSTLKKCFLNLQLWKCPFNDVEDLLYKEDDLISAIEKMSFYDIKEEEAQIA